MKLLISILLVSLIGMPLMADCPRKENDESYVAVFDGEWEFVRVTKYQKCKRELIVEIVEMKPPPRLLFRRGNMTGYWQGSSQPNPAVLPKTVDLYGTDAYGKALPAKAIYRIEKEILFISLAFQPRIRPGGFACEGLIECRVYEFRRVPPRDEYYLK
jgi:hypothetical protein